MVDPASDAAPDPVRETEVAIPARDGFPLAASVFRRGAAGPEAPGEVDVLVLPAMAVPQRFYRRFAAWLGGIAGVRAVTFDLRGMGRSRREKPLRSFADVTVRTWAEQDAPAVFDWVARGTAKGGFRVVGHSLGGPLLGIAPGAAERVERAVTVAAGSGYYGHHPGPRWPRRVLFHHGMPTLARLFGYYPGARLGIVGDLPKGVAVQWARWCTTPHYLIDDDGRPDRSGFRRFAAPILALSMRDDALISKAAVDDLHGWFQKAPVSRRHLDAAAFGLDRIGHFGFFREPALWPLARSGLGLEEDRAAPSAPAAAAS
jgi:predicted alpha/beta hydrolase